MEVQVSPDGAMAVPPAQPANTTSQNPPPPPPPPQQQKKEVKQEVTLELRKYILLLASMVATMTYAAGFSPPGDVWQDTAAGHIAGDPIIRDTQHRRYVAFFYCNATAFAASLVVIVITLALAYLDDYKDKYAASRIVIQYKDKQWFAVRTLQAAMLLDLLSLLGAFAAGTCRDTFTTVYSSLLVGFVFFYVLAQVAWATGSGFCSGTTGAGAEDQDKEERQPGPGAGVAAGDEEERQPASLENAGSGDVLLEEHEAADERRQKRANEILRKVGIAVVASMLGRRPRSRTRSSGSSNPKSRNGEEEQEVKADDRLRKVLILLATFAVSITYSAGLSTPGGFWDSAGAGHRPGDAILEDRHGTRLAVFFGFNTLAFVASLLIIVVLLDTKLRGLNAYGFIVVALVSLIGAYNAGSCRETDTTVYVFSLIPAVLFYIAFLYFAYGRWRKLKEKFSGQPQQAMAARSDGRVNTSGTEEKTEEKTEKEKAADKARSLVLLLATLAATITYQAGLVPPGGVWQDNSGGHTAGDPVLLTTSPRRYKAFYYCNSVSLVASLVAIVLAQKKLLLKHHVLEAVMILDLFGLIGAYAAGSCRDVNTSLHAMALAGAVLVYVVIHVIFITLDDGTHTWSHSDKDGKDPVEKTRKRLLLFAILAATITYQAGLTPPGGFLLQDDQSGHHAGDPVLLYNFPRRYRAFFYCNSVSFMLSIALIILLVNPNVYRPAIRAHALSVCTAAGLFGLMGAYAAGSTQHLKTSVYIFVLVAVVIFFIVLLFLVFCSTGCSSKTVPKGAQPVETATNTEDNKDQDEEKKKRIHANRKYLMLLGILVASVTYQGGLQPPGGAWQSSNGGYEAGNSVMHDNRRPRYLAFFYSNSTSFMASVVVILLLLIPPKKLGGDEQWLSKSRWLVVMNTTIVLDLLGLLGAYAAGSSRQWQTSVHVLLLVIAVLIYMGFHLLLSCCIIRRRNRHSAHSSGAIAATRV